MSEPIWISQLLLWVMVIALSLACLALARQVGLLLERVAPAGALAMNRRLAGGEHAPSMSLESIQGEPLTIGIPSAGEAHKSQLLFFLSPECPVCKRLLPVLKSIHRRERAWLDIVLASDGESEMHRRFIEEHDLAGFPYVISQRLGIAYGVSKLPYGVLIGAHGRVSALGLVSTREHLESLLEAHALRRPTIQEFLEDASTPSSPVSRESMQ